MAVGTVGKILIMRLQQSGARIDGGEQSVGDSTGSDSRYKIFEDLS
jgi:hypothetical protein